MKPVIQEITAAQLNKTLPHFKVGDGVKVHAKVREGDKERVQIFGGIVIARKGHGIHETFTVRRIASGVGVERVFPLNSPNIVKIEIDRVSKPMRARLYYLRDRVGKKAVQVKVRRLTEAMGDSGRTSATVAAPAATPEAPES